MRSVIWLPQDRTAIHGNTWWALKCRGWAESRWGLGEMCRTSTLMPLQVASQSSSWCIGHLVSLVPRGKRLVPPQRDLPSGVLGWAPFPHPRPGLVQPLPSLTGCSMKFQSAAYHFKTRLVFFFILFKFICKGLVVWGFFSPFVFFVNFLRKHRGKAARRLPRGAAAGREGKESAKNTHSKPNRIQLLPPSRFAPASPTKTHKTPQMLLLSAAHTAASLNGPGVETGCFRPI